MWKRTVSWLVRLVDALLRADRARQPVPSVPAPRPAPPVLISVGAPSAPPAAPTWPPTLTWSQAWQAAWRPELLDSEAADPEPLPPPPPPRPRRSMAWLFSVLLAELQAGVVLGAVWEVVRS